MTCARGPSTKASPSRTSQSSSVRQAVWARASALLGGGDVLVWNGDILSDLDPRRPPHTPRHDADSPRQATLAVHARPAGKGNVGFAADGRIVRLRSSSFGAEAHGGDFLGIHVVGEPLRAGLPD